jgi:hypothetical protein
VTGHFRAGGEFHQGGLTRFQQEGPVTCLVVEGNRESPDDGPPSEQDSECVVPPVTPTLFTLQKGNFAIHDAP